MKQDIITWKNDPQGILATKCTPCNVTPETIKLGSAAFIAACLLEAAESVKAVCAGLSANQIGFSERVMVAKINGVFKPFINPKVVVYYPGIKSDIEGCLSLPGERHSVRRHKKIRLSWVDLETGVPMEEDFRGFEARAIQHECDHLKGKRI